MSDDRTHIEIQVPTGMDSGTWKSAQRGPVAIMLPDDGEPRVQLIVSPGDFRIVPADARWLAAALAVWADLAEKREPDPADVESVAAVIRRRFPRLCDDDRINADGYADSAARAVLAALPGMGYTRRPRFCPECTRTEGDGFGAEFDGPPGQPCRECRRSIEAERKG